MKRRPKFVLVVLAFMLLVVVMVAVIPGFLYHEQPTLKQPLATLIPANIPGWQSKTLPIAQSVELQRTVISILRYDDALFRVYEKPGLQVQIYIAYWKPGSVPYGQAGAHTPDTCWVANGWTCEQRRRSVRGNVAEVPLKPYEFGVFANSGERLNVIFWHLVGGRPYDYDQSGWRNGLIGYIERSRNLWSDLKTFGLNLRHEQFVVRISSSQSFDRLWNDPDFCRLMRALQATGIFAASRNVKSPPTVSK